jgi:hypothetical protein
MNILYNKGNICIFEGETEMHCYSYNTLVAIYNKLMNNYTLMDSYILHGEVKKMSPTSRKHQNIFIREYIPSNAILIK